MKQSIKLKTINLIAVILAYWPTYIELYSWRTKLHFVIELGNNTIPCSVVGIGMTCNPQDKSNKRQVRMVGRNGRVISESGAEQAIRRLCQPNKRGQKKASQDIVNQFFAGGDSRKELIKLFIESGGNHDSCPSFSGTKMFFYPLKFLKSSMIIFDLFGQPSLGVPLGSLGCFQAHCWIAHSAEACEKGILWGRVLHGRGHEDRTWIYCDSW